MVPAKSPAVLLWSKQELERLEDLLLAIGPGRYPLLLFLLVRDAPVNKPFLRSEDDVRALCKSLILLYTAAYRIVMNAAAMSATAAANMDSTLAAAAAPAAAAAGAALVEERDEEEGVGEEVGDPSRRSLAESTVCGQVKSGNHARKKAQHEKLAPLVKLLKPYVQVRALIWQSFQLH